MTYIERELAVHLSRLSGLVGQQQNHAQGLRSVADYLEAALGDWGFAVERPPARATGGAFVIGRAGIGLPSRVRLWAALGDDPGAEAGDGIVGGLAVLLSLGQILAQYQLRHGLELVASGAVTSGAPEAGPAPQQLVAAVTFAGRGGPLWRHQLSACSASAELAAGVRLLLARYPEVVWAEPAPCADGPGDGIPWLAVAGVAPQAPLVDGDADGLRWLREAVMLGAEIVALLQTHTAGSARPGGA